MKHIGKSYKLVKSLDNVYDYIQLENGSFDEFLTVKVAMILGVCGALRASEICALEFEDIEYQQELINVNIRSSKTDQSSSGHSFFISPNSNKNQCFCELIKRYIQCFPAEQQTGRFLRKLSKIGKGTNRPIGVNIISVYAKNLADTLSLSGNFTSHCFRRSSATIAADAGADMMSIKRHGQF